MILVDTNVWVALTDERDRLHQRAVRDLKKLDGPFGVPSVVLAEACFLLEEGYLRKRLRLLLERLTAVAVEPEAPWWEDVFAWLERYEDHTPDFTDALLAVMSARASAAIWTYDAEFRKVWRRPDGKALRVVPAQRS